MIDAHAKSISGHKNAVLAGVVSILCQRALSARQASVVVIHAQKRALELLAHALGRFSRAAVNDHATVGGLLDRAVKEALLLLFIVAGFHLVVEIGAVKTVHVPGGIVEAEALGDVFQHDRSSRSGEGEHGNVGAQFFQHAELAVFFAEIVAPLGDAVSFIHCKERDPLVHDPALEAFFGYAFGGNVEHVSSAFGDIGEHAHFVGFSLA